MFHDKLCISSKPFAIIIFSNKHSPRKNKYENNASDNSIDMYVGKFFTVCEK